MKQKLFYIKSYNALVFCHGEIDTKTLILSGLNGTIQDAIEDNSRQSIDKDVFEGLGIVEVTCENPTANEFLKEYSPGTYGVIDYKQKWYLEEALALPSVIYKSKASTYHGNPLNKKTGQIGLDFS